MISRIPFRIGWEFDSCGAHMAALIFLKEIRRHKILRNKTQPSKIWKQSFIHWRPRSCSPPGTLPSSKSDQIVSIGALVPTLLPVLLLLLRLLAANMIHYPPPALPTSSSLSLLSPSPSTSSSPASLWSLSFHQLKWLITPLPSLSPHHCHSRSHHLCICHHHPSHHYCHHMTVGIQNDSSAQDALPIIVSTGVNVAPTRIGFPMIRATEGIWLYKLYQGKLAKLSKI